MQLRDYIRYKNAKDFYDGSVEAKFLNAVTIPSPADILKHQKEMFQTFAGKYGFNDPAIKELNNDLMGKYQNQVNYNFDEIITKIENYTRSLNSNDPEKIKEKMTLTAQLEGQVENVDQLIREYMNFFKNLESMQSMSEVQYALRPIYEKLKNLELTIQSITQGGAGAPPTGTLSGRVSWCEYIIKGQYLESEGKKFISENLPTGLKVIQTGQLKGYYDIFGQFKNSGSMKEDLMILNDDNFQISFTMGKDAEVKQMSLKKFLEFMENRKDQKTIRLTQAGYDALVSHLVTAVQAKATSSNKIRFGKVNVNNRKGGIAEDALLTLKKIYKSQEKKTLLVKHDDYQALFNYNLAHYLGHIVGKNNRLLLTRKGLVDMHSFIMEQFDANRYFYGLEDFNLKSNAGVPVGLNFSE